MKNMMKRILAIALGMVALAMFIRAVHAVRGNPYYQDDDDNEKEEAKPPSQVSGKAKPADKDDDDDEEKKEAAKTPSRVSVENGETILTLDQETQNSVGITVAPLKTAVTREQVRAPAVVLSVQDLITLRDNLLTAQNKLKKAEVSLDTSRKEYERLKILNENDQNASLKSVESAEASFRSDQADVDVARQEVSLQDATVTQTWGSVVAKWMVDTSPALERVLDRQEVLIQVTIPASETSFGPPTITIEIYGGKVIGANLVSSFPRVDPRIQGTAFLYVTPAQPSLAPGVNLMARLPEGQLMHGVSVPTAAVLWWEGKAWVFLQTAPNRFTRRILSTENPLRDGYFVEKGFSSQDKVVVRGAQALFSEEFRSQIQGGDTD